SWDSVIRAHAARALRAAAAHRKRIAPPPDDPVGRAIVHATALWNEGLFFEVHEVLEAVWQRESGDRRQALQGVIQIAVAWHHLAHGNPRGARTLLREGRARLAASPPETLPLLDCDALVAETEPAASALGPSGAPRQRAWAGGAPGGPPPRHRCGSAAEPAALRTERAPAATSARTRPGGPDHAGCPTPHAPPGNDQDRLRLRDASSGRPPASDRAAP